LLPGEVGIRCELVLFFERLLGPDPLSDVLLVVRNLAFRVLKLLFLHFLRFQNLIILREKFVQLAGRALVRRLQIIGVLVDILHCLHLAQGINLSLSLDAFLL
jgi:hypothetical protein